MIPGTAQGVAAKSGIGTPEIMSGGVFRGNELLLLLLLLLSLADDDVMLKHIIIIMLAIRQCVVLRCLF